MATARRCTECGTNWPNFSAYTDCPLCETETWTCYDGDDPLTRTEAEQLVKTHQEKYQRAADVDRQMDLAFDGWFCRENGIVNPAVALADRSTGAPLDELIC